MVRKMTISAKAGETINGCWNFTFLPPPVDRTIKPQPPRDRYDYLEVE